MNSSMPRLEVVDSHTGGEPTRLVVGGGPDLGRGSMAERRERFRRAFDAFRSAVVNEPRGSDVMVGALLCEPCDPSCAAGVIFFNNVGVLNMCGHGTMGLLVSLAYLGRIGPGVHRIETPVGIVTAELHDAHTVTLANVPSRRIARQQPLDLGNGVRVHGDIAWGGNWFFLCHDHGQKLASSRVAELTDFTRRMREAIVRQGLTGEGGAEIDHVELFGDEVSVPGARSRNFVLCPGLAYDRSPCGTGTSAKLACLFADGVIAEREVWRQESIIGSWFDGWIEVRQGQVVPFIRGTAHVCGEGRLILDPDDPFREGIRG